MCEKNEAWRDCFLQEDCDCSTIYCTVFVFKIFFSLAGRDNSIQLVKSCLSVLTMVALIIITTRRGFLSIEFKNIINAFFKRLERYGHIDCVNC